MKWAIGIARFNDDQKSH